MELSESEPLSGTFDALYRATASDVFAYAMTLVRDRAAAEDVTALAFERAFRRQSSFDARRGTQRAWVFGIARHAALDELRRRGRAAVLIADADEVAHTAAPDGDDEEAAVRRATVRRALEGMDARDRELVALKFHAGLSNAEIGRVLGVSESNAGTRVHRAVSKLRKACHDLA